MKAFFSVDTEALHGLADRIRQVVADVRAVTFGSGPMPADQAALAVPALVRATGSFVESWGTALTDLVDDTERLADALALAAGAYQDAESVIDRSSPWW